MRENKNAGSSKLPIGIFDSGLGGLTVMSAIMKALPNENIIYFGDTAHVPYGSKSKEVVTRYSLDIASFLVSKKVKMIVVACNTASAVALDELRRKFDVPIIEVIGPGAKAALSATKYSRIGVIGTEGTIRSSSYTKAIRKLRPGAKIFARACPLFVPLVEEGWLGHKVTKIVAREYIKPLLNNKIDTLVLGCTHYPLIKKVIAGAAGKRVELIDSAETAASEVVEILTELGITNRSTRKGSYQYFVSDIPQKFSEVARRFLGRSIKPVRKVVL
jgi:glutamate racemase